MNNRPRLWDENVLRQSFEMAQLAGIARVETPDADSARRLRLRLYDFRKTNNLGQGIVITLDNNSVILTKQVPNSSEIKITPETPDNAN